MTTLSSFVFLLHLFWLLDVLTAGGSPGKFSTSSGNGSRAGNASSLGRSEVALPAEQEGECHKVAKKVSKNVFKCKYILVWTGIFSLLDINMGRSPVLAE